MLTDGPELLMDVKFRQIYYYFWKPKLLMDRCYTPPELLMAVRKKQAEGRSSTIPWLEVRPTFFQELIGHLVSNLSES